MRCDAAEAIDPAVLDGCDAVVNLVGIKRERGGATFERCHVRAVEHLVAAMIAANVTRLVHVSVAMPDPPAHGEASPYRRTKRAAEALVRASGLRWTVLRPGIVVGPGDDAIRGLVAAIRHAPVFPMPGRGSAPLALVDVRDVAAAVCAALHRQDAIGGTFDVVGPAGTSLRELVRRTAAATGLPTLALPVPVPIVRAAARVMERRLLDPPVTRAQLHMLVSGVPGDPSQTRALGLAPRPLDAAHLRDLAAANQRPLFGASLRTVWTDAQRAELAARAQPRRAALRIVVGLAALLLAPLWLPSPFIAVASANLVMFALVPGTVLFAVATLRWPDRGGWGLAAGAAAFAWLAGAGVQALLSAGLPDLAGQAQRIADPLRAVPLGAAIPLLVLVVAAEEAWWRIGVGLALAHHLGPAKAIGVAALAFGVAHATVGPPLLVLAAVGCGAVWSFLAIRTRNVAVGFASHLAWDVAVLWVAPLA